MKIGAAYIRVSSDDQMEYSPDSQLKAVRDYAKREGYLIPDEYVYQDDGISGKSASKRPAFRLMIANAKEKDPPFESIFVWKFSRFARNQEEAIMYKNLLKKKGISVKSVSEPSNDSPFASLIERIIEWMDEYYLINLSTEVKRGMKEKASRGEALTTPPFGYRMENRELVIDEENAEIVRYIFSQYISGKGMRSLATELGEKGVRTKRGNLPDNRFVEYILRNITYTGKIRWSEDGRIDYRKRSVQNERSIISDGKHKPIIDNETWERAQKKISKRNNEPKYVRKKEPNMFMLKGLVRCGACGSTLTFLCSKAPALQCCSYARGVCNVSHYINLSKATSLVLSGLDSVLISGDFTFAPETAQERKLSRDWDRMIAAEENKLRRAKNALLDGVFSNDEYKKIKEELEGKISRLTSARDAEEKAPAPIDTEAFREKTMNVLDILKSPDVDEYAKNQALRSIVEKIIYNKASGTLDIYFCH